MFEATYRVVTESDLSSKQFDDAFKPILVKVSSHKAVWISSMCCVSCSGSSSALCAQLPGRPSGQCLSPCVVALYNHCMTLQASNERIEVLTLLSKRIGDQEGGKGDRSDTQESKDLKQRGRSLLQSAVAPPASADSTAARAAAALNPGASMQGQMPFQLPAAVSTAGLTASSSFGAKPRFRVPLRHAYMPAG